MQYDVMTLLRANLSTYSDLLLECHLCHFRNDNCFYIISVKPMLILGLIDISCHEDVTVGSKDCTFLDDPLVLVHWVPILPQEFSPRTFRTGVQAIGRTKCH